MHCKKCHDFGKTSDFCIFFEIVSKYDISWRIFGDYETLGFDVVDFLGFKIK